MSGMCNVWTLTLSLLTKVNEDMRIVCVGFDRDLQRTMHFCISAGRTLLHLDPHRHPKAKGLFNRDNSQLTVKPLALLA